MTYYVRRELTPLAATTLVDAEIAPDIGTAYSLLRRMIGDDPVFGAAWKLGGTTFATRKAFHVEKLYFGPLHESEVMTTPDVAPGFPLFELKGEAEIALRISADLPSDPAAVAASSFTELFDLWCVALELPSSPIVNLADAGVAALVADRCAAGALVLGAARPYGSSTSWEGARFRVTLDGQAIAEGSIDAVVEPPDMCAKNFLVEAIAQGFAPSPGQWVSTGGLTPCVPFRDGGRVEVYHGEDAVISFRAGFDMT